MSSNQKILALEAALTACEGIGEFAQERIKLAAAIEQWVDDNYKAATFELFLDDQKKAVLLLATCPAVWGGL